MAKVKDLLLLGLFPQSVYAHGPMTMLVLKRHFIFPNLGHFDRKRNSYLKLVKSLSKRLKLFIGFVRTK